MPADGRSRAGNIVGNGADDGQAHEKAVAGETPPMENVATTDPEELGRRLVEQVRQNVELDQEVRYLQQELAIRNEFALDLESEIERLHGLLGEHQQVIVEYREYRNRVGHRTVDGLIVRVQRVPLLYRGMRKMGHIGMSLGQGRRRALPPTAASGDEIRSADPIDEP